MLRFIVALVIVTIVAAEKDLEPRFGFPEVTTDPAGLSILFNQTSINNAIFAGGVFLLLTVLVLPILGISVFGGAFDIFGLQDAYRRRDRNNVYAEYDPNSYYDQQEYSQRRSLSVLSPVLSALKSAYDKYEAQVLP